MNSQDETADGTKEDDGYDPIECGAQFTCAQLERGTPAVLTAAVRFTLDRN